MIKVFCDCCEEYIGEYNTPNAHAYHHNEFQRVGWNQVCDKCNDAYEKLRLADVLRPAILNARPDIPRCAPRGEEST